MAPRSQFFENATEMKTLQALEKIRATFGRETGIAKIELLELLDRSQLASPTQVLALHEILCFLRAYPDDAAVLQRVERMLDRFESRSDLRRHREALVDSGIAGTAIHYRFFWPMARWLADRWPERLHLDWRVDDHSDRLASALPVLVTHAEAAAIKRSSEGTQAILQRLTGAATTDATFVVKRIGALAGDDFTREALHDGIDAPYRLDPGPGSPSRTHALHRTGPIVFQRQPLARERPDLRAELSRGPLDVRDVSRREGRALIDRACEAMVTRSRDLEVFVYGDPNDVRLVIDRDGLAFAVIGFLPERRLLMRAAYGLLTLKNGVPIGYVQSDALFKSSEIAFNAFDTFRGGEAGLVFARLLAVVKRLFGAASFSIEPYQLGQDNEEGLTSGAWWFYYKLGFRPAHVAVQRIVERELARMRKDPSHRSSRATLERLAEHHLYFDLDPERQPIEADLARLGWTIAERMSARFGADRERATETMTVEAAQRLGLSSWSAKTAGERIAIARLSPIILALPGVERWSATDRRRAAEVVKAKGGHRESDFVRRFDAHPKLARAIARLAAQAS